MKLLKHANGACPIDNMLSVMGGKWKLLIVYYLMTEKTLWFGELKRRIQGVTNKMFSSRLRELEL